MRKYSRYSLAGRSCTLAGVSAEPLRVFLNASAVPSRPAGAGVYTLELARALAARQDVALTVAAPPFATIFGARTVASPAGSPLHRSVWEQLAMPRLLADVDVYHGAHFATPLHASVPRVATVHDLTFYRLPRRYPRRHRWYYRALAHTATHAERIIVPSRAVAADVVRFLGYPPQRIRVVAEAPRTGLAPASATQVAQTLAQLGVERPYLLCLGTAEPGKRAVDAIRALALLRDRGQAVQLVLAGNAGPLTAALKREAVRLSVEDRVRFAGYVEEGRLAPLYTAATALIFPSLYEGFGLPPLEAMARGTPVIATQAQAMREVLGDAAILVPLRDPVAIADAAQILLEQTAAAAGRAARGFAHVSRFSWARAAAETMAVYQELTQ